MDSPHLTLEQTRGFNNKSAVLREKWKPLSNLKMLESQYGLTKEHTLASGRTFVLHSSPTHDPTKPVPLLIFFHGSRGNGMFYALEVTKLIEKTVNQDFLIVFGQAQGVRRPDEFVYPDPKYGGVAFGELYWEIRDNDPGFPQDLQYIQDVFSYVDASHKIDKSQLYAMGHSNGGVFCCLLALHMPNTFKGICSHMGGIGWDPGFYLDWSVLKDTDRKTPILMVTGDLDEHRIPSEAGTTIFRDEGFDVTFKMLENTKHCYLALIEDYVWDWFMNL